MNVLCVTSVSFKQLSRTHLKPCQTSMVEPVCANSQGLNVKDHGLQSIFKIMYFFAVFVDFDQFLPC